MTKKSFMILLSLFFFLPSVSRSQTWVQSPRLDSLRAACYCMLGMSSSGTALITTAKVDDAIQNAQTQVCIDFPAIEKIDTVTTGKQQEGAALPSDFLRARSVFRIKGDTLRVPLLPVGLDTLRRVAGAIDDNVYERGNVMTSAFYYTFANRLMIHPKVSVDTSTPDTFLVYYYAMDGKLSATTDSTKVLPEYIKPLLDYACSGIAAMRGDFKTAAYFKDEYLSALRARKPRVAELKQ